MLEKIISGGQTGADKSGLIAARAIGIPTGGTTPKGWRICLPDGSDGNDSSLFEFGLTQSPHFDYKPRTQQNIQDSDGTVWLGFYDSPGGRLTIYTAGSLNKPILINPTPKILAEWVKRKQIKVLNVAGNRASTWNPDICADTYHTIVNALVPEIPRHGEVYRHFKGTDYTIVDVAHPLLAQALYPAHTALHTETEQELFIWYASTNSKWGLNCWAMDSSSNLVPEALVLYQESEGSRIWARPLRNFLQVLFGGDAGYASNYRRFTKLEGQDATHS
jgi:hypothetical protein